MKHIKRMGQIFKNPIAQLVSGILIIFASFIISTLQGTYGFKLPLMLLGFCILEIVLLYIVIVIPTIELLRPQPTESDRVYSLERLKEFELTSDIREIWVITSSLSLAFDSDQFGSTINTNISRGITYKFYIVGGGAAIAKERAAAMISRYGKAKNGRIHFYWSSHDLPFVDQNTDCDLFFLNGLPNIRGFIGSTIDNKREYTLTTQDVAFKLKAHIEALEFNNWDTSS